jgi:putative salt-induced outer membrane protein
MIRYPLLAAPLLAIALPATAQPIKLPPGTDPADTLAAMIAAAYRTGDDATINAVVGVAKATFPDQVAVIDRLAAGDAAVLAQTRKEAQEREQTRIQQARFYEIWKGQLEAGASRSTGTTRTLGVYAAASLTREGINWRQKFNGRLDLQQTDNVTTTERLIMAWQPNYKFDERLYAYGLGQYEHDRSLGYQHRFTLGGGVGYTAIATARAKVELEGGPALRRTNFVELPSRTTIAGRASMNAQMALSPTLSLSQVASVFIESRNATASSTSALDTKLIGALKARLSYNVQYERNQTVGGRSLDTVTRATLVYDF